MLRLSKRLRSCSKAKESGVEVFIGGVATGGAAAWALGFAETEAGTKDIIVVAGFVGVAEGPVAGFPALKLGELALPLGY
jgi:hypothetical protein